MALIIYLKLFIKLLILLISEGSFLSASDINPAQATIEILLESAAGFSALLKLIGSISFFSESPKLGIALLISGFDWSEALVIPETPKLNLFSAFASLLPNKLVFVVVGCGGLIWHGLFSWVLMNGLGSSAFFGIFCVFAFEVVKGFVTLLVKP